MNPKTPYLIANLLQDLGIVNQAVVTKAVNLYIKNAAAKSTLASSGLAGALGGLTSGGAKGLLTSSTKLLSLSLDTAFTVVGAIWTVGTFLSARKKRKKAQRKRERATFRQGEIDSNSSKIEEIINYSRSTGKQHRSDLGSALLGNLDYDKAEQIVKGYAVKDTRDTLISHFKADPGHQTTIQSDKTEVTSTNKEKNNEETPQIPKRT